MANGSFIDNSNDGFLVFHHRGRRVALVLSKEIVDAWNAEEIILEDVLADADERLGSDLFDEVGYSDVDYEAWGQRNVFVHDIIRNADDWNDHMAWGALRN